ncbi:unnamed protein product [Cylicocyclus nassatus]|uniref:Uncharacterized protein n=1 Tax=Cylicocyclus nassatus TaxID=53992 RepID=A0AA36MAF1_CYLNA|nr:unnamed protein product [Cylicocyclus nassatus]
MFILVDALYDLCSQPCSTIVLEEDACLLLNLIKVLRLRIANLRPYLGADIRQYEFDAARLMLMPPEKKRVITTQEGTQSRKRKSGTCLRKIDSFFVVLLTDV